MRRITTAGRRQTRTLNDLMQNLLVAELLAPSRQLWVLSPWISDVDVIDNTAGQFKTVLPGSPSRRIRLTEVLIELARRGSEVRVLTRDVESNIVVRQRLENVGGPDGKLEKRDAHRAPAGHPARAPARGSARAPRPSARSVRRDPRASRR